MESLGARGVALAFELTELGEQIVAQSFRRAHPDADEAAVRARVREWYRDVRRAPGGDCPGRVVEAPFDV
jgi:hypothetical protein